MNRDHDIIEIGFHKLYRDTYVCNSIGVESTQGGWSEEAEKALRNFIKLNMMFDGETIELKKGITWRLEP